MALMDNKVTDDAVDELLAYSENYSDFGDVMKDIPVQAAAHASLGPEMSTGVYDLDFFKIPPVLKPANMALDDARVGLSLFLEEARTAMQTGELSDEQRIQINTIATYVEGLARRFDRIRSPEFAKADVG